MFDPQQPLAPVIKEVRDYFGKVFKAVIPRNVGSPSAVVREADIVLYDATPRRPHPLARGFCQGK